ncbi:MAG: hypothetical protein IPJ01_07655 [Micavibrio sp.]|nr:hypothetical protein [Micavibrio sp.]
MTTMVDPRVTDIEMRGMRLELIYGADSCRNIDRIARAPACINWPTADKRDKKGQKPVMARIVEADFSRAYPLSAFPALSSRTYAAATTPIEIEEEARLESVDDLDRYNVPARGKQSLPMERLLISGRREITQTEPGWLRGFVGCSGGRCRAV